MSATVGSVPPPLGVIPNFNHPEDIMRTTNLVTGILAISLITIFVFFRLYIRIFTAGGFDRDDPTCLATCVLAWALSVGYFITGIFMGLHGGGENRWEVTEKEMLGFQKALYGDTIVYGPSAVSTKTTILLLFARVFSPFKKTVMFIYVFIGLMLLYYVPIMGIKAGICNPISGLWDKTIPTKCIDEKKVFITDTITSVVTDLVVLILPIVLTYSLQIATRKKIRIMGLLAAGGLATGASIVRLILVFQPHSFENITVTFVRFNLLGVAELSIGLICACIPAISGFFARKKRIVQDSQRAQYSNSIILSRRKQSSKPKLQHTSLMGTKYMDVESGRNVVIANSITPSKSSGRVLVAPILTVPPSAIIVSTVISTAVEDNRGNNGNHLWQGPWDGSQLGPIGNFEDAHRETFVSTDGKNVVRKPLPPIPQFRHPFDTRLVPLSRSLSDRRPGDTLPW